MSLSITIKTKLFQDPRVRRIARELRAAGIIPSSAPPALATSLVVGALATLWAYADTHISDDDTLAVTPADVDEIVGIAGFANLLPVDWLQILDGETIKLPSFSDHNGASIRIRAGARERVKRYRERVSSRSGNGDGTHSVTRNDTRTDALHVTPVTFAGSPPPSPSFSPLTLPPLTPPSLPSTVSNTAGAREAEPAGEGTAAAEATAARRASRRASRRAPADFEVTPALSAWFTKNIRGVDHAVELATFLDHTFATSKLDWPATYRNWMRESMKRNARNFRAAPGAPTMGRDAPTPTPAQIEAARRREAEADRIAMARLATARAGVQIPDMRIKR